MEQTGTPRRAKVKIQDEPISVRFPSNWLVLMRALAVKQGLDLSTMIRDAVKAYVAAHKGKGEAGIHKDARP